MSAATATQSVSTFAPEGIWLSGKLGSDSFVSREDAYGCAPAGPSPHRSDDALPRYLNRPPTPAPIPEPFPVTPLPLSVLSQAAYGVQSPLDKPIMRLNDAGAIQNNAYSQDVIGFQSSLASRPSRDRYCAAHHDDYVTAIPTMGPLHHRPAIKVEFPHQYNDVEGSQASTFSQSTASLLSLPAQRDAPATDNLCGLMPMTLKRSLALRYRPEDLWDAGAHHSKPLHKARLAEKTRAVLSRLRHKLLRNKSWEE